jgi:hypothetical protein
MTCHRMETTEHNWIHFVTPRHRKETLSRILACR